MTDVQTIDIGGQTLPVRFEEKWNNLSFLLYQFGDDVETDKQNEWIDRLSEKL